MKNFIFLIAICFSTALLSSCQDEKEESLPNIVFIISDDQAWTDYSFTGHPHIETPNIDKLAKEGHTFSRGYVPTSLCSPSLATIATGLYPRRHKILGNDRILPTDNPEDRKKVRGENFKPMIEMFKSYNTLPKMLKEKGYMSFQTGKWWLGNPSVGGFDEGMTHGDRSRGGRHGDEGLEIGRKGIEPIKKFVNKTLDQEKPFFLWYAPFLPHAPHTPPDSLLKKYIDKAPTEYVAKYWAMCEWFDETCGELIDYIDQKGQTENTLYVYVCDNGWVQNENNGSYNPNSKRSPYDYGMRTPIIFNWKGKTTSILDEKSLVSSIDLIPTVLNLIGMEIPEGLDGIDALNPSSLTEREVIFGEIYKHDFHEIDNSHLYDIAISNPYKLIVPSKTNNTSQTPQLYNIYQDPTEQNNIIEDHPEVVKDLETKIENSWADVTK